MCSLIWVYTVQEQYDLGVFTVCSELLCTVCSELSCPSKYYRKIPKNRSNFGEVDVAPAKTDKVNKVEK